MTPRDTIVGPARGSIDDVLPRLQPGRDEAVVDYLEEVFRLAPLVGLDPAIIVSQSAHETANWTSPAWVDWLNPAGLGITYSGQDPGYRWASGTDAARAQIVHLAAYAHGALFKLTGSITDANREIIWDLRPFAKLDPRLGAIPDRWMGTVRTLNDLSGRWATDKRYAEKIAAKGNALFPNLPDQEEPMADLQFGRVPKPTIIPMIVPKPPYNAGYTLVAPRRVLGACRHITDGLASLEWYAEFFGPGGERYLDALTDFGVDQAGRIAMWNDPFGTRAPWASGGSDGLEGDGPLFVRTLGIGMINAGLASVEHVQKAPGRMTDAQLDASARLLAWIFDGASNHPRGSKVPWSSFPLNPNVGCVTDMEHWEFATKSCPAAGIIAQRDALQNRIRALLKRGQEGESQGEIPPPEPVEPDHGRYPEGMDKALATRWFGQATLHRTGRRDSHFGFHEGHAVCEAWLERGSKEQAYPSATHWWQFEDQPGVTRHVVEFANGWRLWRANAREGWRWIG